MAKSFRKILCPVDFDDKSIEALDYACELATGNDATLYVMHVVFTPLVSPEFAAEGYPSVSEEPSKYELEKLARKHLAGKARYELIIRTGKPADIINQVAEDLDADLIVLATHGRTGVSRFFLGSTAEHVVRGARRPVLTIRPAA